MVVGIDSYHDATKGKQSVAGFVASMNRSCTRWYSNVCFQRPGQELVHGLQICLTAALRKYHADNHFLPEKIVIYRDGVGDGQLDMLADHEVKQLHRCFSSFGDYAPQCTTVCVQKRINTRIYGKDRDRGGMVNPPPGTVVDSVVTRRDRYDFFIVSQHVRQGTVSPTHYIVVDDGLDLAPGYMQRLTYKMTHLYYNWPGTVRVPAPCQYAHKLAYLVGESIHKEPAECLSDRLFFL
ncbi:piwi protein [Plakobranchus ocellatus]|uniref:Piwi protein n=1 Tax=Plakobranchus ocellatus TaxID=259542 RepID=A0AAV3Y7J8_9GAST|nr:piwi protein [Plakobranchus ocellatus]